MKKRLQSLDTMKTIGAIGIMLYHYLIVFNADFGVLTRYIGMLGVIGDDLFFSTSGYLIAYTYKKRIISGMSGGEFLKKRILVLYPPYITSLIMGAIVSGSCGLLMKEVWIMPVTYENIMYSLSMTNDLLSLNKQTCNHPYGSGLWFICGLFVCYCLYYLIVRTCSKDNTIYLIISLGVIFYSQYLVGNLGSGFFRIKWEER